MKLCTECKWMSNNSGDGNLQCKHPDAGRDPATGYKPVSVRCADARYGSSQHQPYLATCGMSGSLWEPIEEKPND